MIEATERIFFVGGSGNVGAKAVQDLVSKNIPVTLYTRDAARVAQLFSDSSQLINVIQGDFSDLNPLKEGLKGHTRLFLLYNSFTDFVETKEAIAKLAYASGIKQIVDISSILASGGWRTSSVGNDHASAEKAILDIPQRGAFVALRPGRFMSNLLNFERLTPEGEILDTVKGDTPQAWVSPNDIGAVAAVVLSEDIKKHGDSVYELISDIVTPNEHAFIASHVLGRLIRYQQISASTKYDHLVKQAKLPHCLAYPLSTSMPSMFPITNISSGISIFLQREPETLEQYIILNKTKF